MTCGKSFRIPTACRCGKCSPLKLSETTLWFLCMISTPAHRLFFRNTSRQWLTGTDKQRVQLFLAMQDLSATKARCKELVSKFEFSHFWSCNLFFIYNFSKWANSSGKRDLECHNPVDLWTPRYSSSKLGLQVRSQTVAYGFIPWLTIHSLYRSLDPTKIITDDKRLRFSFIGITDIITNDPNQQNPFQLVNHYQQVSPRRRCKGISSYYLSVLGWLDRIRKTHRGTGMPLPAVGSTWSDSTQHRSHFTSLFVRPKKLDSVFAVAKQNEINCGRWAILGALDTSAACLIDNAFLLAVMPKIGARFYTHLELLENHADMVENELLKEIDNGRLYRLLVKLGSINEREWVFRFIVFRSLMNSKALVLFTYAPSLLHELPENFSFSYCRLNLDVTWSETGNRYMLKLFRDYLWVTKG